MVQTINQRVAAKIEGDFVVFLIGARLNRWWKFLSFFPIARAMSRMVGETKPPVISRRLKLIPSVISTEPEGRLEKSLAREAIV